MKIIAVAQINQLTKVIKYFQNKKKIKSKNHKNLININYKLNLIYLVYIPRDKQNNIEKILYEIYESFLYPLNISELLNYLSTKYNSILESGFKDGLKLDKDTEKELLHKICLEGIPFFILEKIKFSVKNFEGSISEQPMLLAHPSGIKNNDLINYLESYSIEQLVKNDYFFVDKKIYYQIDEYKIFDEFKYLYAEGYFDDISLKFPQRKDFIFKFNLNFFNKTKHLQINELCKFIYYLPFELNSKFANLSLQINDYAMVSFFKENYGTIKMNIDSSLENDTGKKLTAIIPIFSRDLEV
jgi:hypothetical protein